MSNEDILKGIVDGAQAEAQGYQDGIDATQDQINALQEKQDALKHVMDENRSALETEQTAVAPLGVFHTYGNYYTGSLLSLNDNIREWQNFEKITTTGFIRRNDNQFYINGDYNVAEFNGTGLDAMSYDSTAIIDATRVMHYRVEIDGNPGGILPDTFKWSDRGGLTWNETNVDINGMWQHLNCNAYINFGPLDGYTIGDYWDFWVFPSGITLYFDTTTPGKFAEATVTSVIYDSTAETNVTVSFSGAEVIPSPLNGLLEYVLEPSGVDWNTDSTTNILIDLMDEFDFSNQYIHTPLGTTGTYGTKAMIASLGTAKTIGQSNKDNALQSETSLTRYATP